MHPLHFKFWGYPIFWVVEARTLRERFGLPDALDARSVLAALLWMTAKGGEAGRTFRCQDESSRCGLCPFLRQGERDDNVKRSLAGIGGTELPGRVV
jgi:hypothetical protein